MGVADRLYETACECRDLETKLDRVLRDLHDERARADRAEELLAAVGRAAGELVERVEEAALTGELPAGTTAYAEALKNLTA